MPELPEVETVTQGLKSVWLGHKFERVICRRSNLRVALPERMEERIMHSPMIHLSRRAKYILVQFANGLTLVSHLGMSGRFVITPFRGQVAPHDHILFTTETGVDVTYVDPRRFGLMSLVETQDITRHKLFCHIGLEPLEDEFNAKYLFQSVQGKKTQLKQVLLAQDIVAGLGNIYVSESLYYARISPLRIAGELSLNECQSLVDAIKKVLKAAITAGGSSLKDHQRPSGELGYFQHQFAVYGKQGQSCPICQKNNEGDSLILRIVQAGRASFYCPKHQK